MDSPVPILVLAGAAVIGTAAVFPKVRARLALSRAKHRSLNGHSKISRLVARLIPFYEFDINDFFRSDGAPAAVGTQRQDGFFRLAGLCEQRFGQSRQLTLQTSTQISDLQFTESYRVPFQYSRLVREHLGAGAEMLADQPAVLKRHPVALGELQVGNSRGGLQSELPALA